MTQVKYTNMAEAQRVMKPAECFEPGYDSIHYKRQDADNTFKATTEKQGLHLSYAEAKAQAFN